MASPISRRNGLALNQERKQLESLLANTQGPPNVVALHPQALKRYEEMIERMQVALARGVKTGDMDASAVIRELVETVTVYRDDSRAGGVQVEITGRLNALLGDQAFPNGIRAVGGFGGGGGGGRAPPRPHKTHSDDLFSN
jgi:site-specific DNA recombinase